MPVTGLQTASERYMRAILATKLPSGHRVDKVWVEIVWTEGEFVAKALTTQGEFVSSKYAVWLDKETRDFSATADTIRGALLELIATIVLEYPVKDNESVDINVPVSEIVNTKTFKQWFRIND